LTRKPAAHADARGPSKITDIIRKSGVRMLPMAGAQSFTQSRMITMTFKGG
jgi:hypothetical protein